MHWSIIQESGIAWTVVGHTLGDTIQPAQRLITVGNFSTFVDRVERLEVEELGGGESTAHNTGSTNNGSVNGVLVLGERHVCRKEDSIIRRGEKAA